MATKPTDKNSGGVQAQPGITVQSDGAKAFGEMVKALNIEYAQVTNRAGEIERQFAEWGLTPTKPSRSNTVLPEELVSSVKEALTGKTVMAKGFNTWLSNVHGYTEIAAQQRVRKKLVEMGITQEKAKIQGTITAVWLVGEQMSSLSSTLAVESEG